MNELFSTNTKKSLQLRENWLYQLFSNRNIEPRHKVIMTAFTFWYYPERRKIEEDVSLDFSALAELAGMPEEETRQALLELADMGVFHLYDRHGHKLDIATQYECEDCGHSWEEK